MTWELIDFYYLDYLPTRDISDRRALTPSRLQSHAVKIFSSSKTVHRKLDFTVVEDPLLAMAILGSQNPFPRSDLALLDPASPTAAPVATADASDCRWPRPMLTHQEDFMNAHDAVPLTEREPNRAHVNLIAHVEVYAIAEQ